MTDAAIAERDGGTAWRRIADELAEAIGRGEYKLGDTLPASVALAERYGVHRHTVRQAFRHLAEQGLVTVSRGRGTQVTAPRLWAAGVASLHSPKGSTTISMRSPAKTPLTRWIGVRSGRASIATDCITDAPGSILSRIASRSLANLAESRVESRT